MIFIICDQDFCKEKKIQDIDCSELEVQELNREYDIIYAVGPQGEIFPVAILRKMCVAQIIGSSDPRSREFNCRFLGESVNVH